MKARALALEDVAAALAAAANGAQAFGESRMLQGCEGADTTKARRIVRGRGSSDEAVPHLDLVAVALENWLPHSDRRHNGLFQLVLDLVQAGAGAGVVEIAARRAGGADRSDHLVTDLDDDASAEQQQMRQFE
jgi:hypothetical protein